MQWIVSTPPFFNQAILQIRINGCRPFKHYVSVFNFKVSNCEKTILRKDCQSIKTVWQQGGKGGGICLVILGFNV